MVRWLVSVSESEAGCDVDVGNTSGKRSPPNKAYYFLLLLLRRTCPNTALSENQLHPPGLFQTHVHARHNLMEMVALTDFSIQVDKKIAA
jgi:hypothetical protein